jgi:hypothetical protein
MAGQVRICIQADPRKSCASHVSQTIVLYGSIPNLLLGVLAVVLWLATLLIDIFTVTNQKFILSTSTPQSLEQF